MARTEAERVAAWIDIGERLKRASPERYDEVERLVLRVVEGQEVMRSVAAPLRPVEAFRTKRYSA